jgi:hypothetical protein
MVVDVVATEAVEVVVADGAAVAPRSSAAAASRLATLPACAWLQLLFVRRETSTTCDGTGAGGQARAVGQGSKS